MSEDINELTMAQLAEKAAIYSALRGEVTGILFTAEKIREMSGHLYAQAMDEEARGARKLAQAILVLATEKKEEYDKQYAGVAAKVWAEIDRREKAQYVEGRG